MALGLATVARSMVLSINLFYVFFLVLGEEVESLALRQVQSADATDQLELRPQQECVSKHITVPA
ncbi:hypothetical protein PR001_g4349 [Phytophthora rubi]|uniref:Uncharacterized protein n=1 Tax=Phytophthora rubi TaxID=129364 RepID=A0A6A3P1P4_9STRA|nr:hypothetical protein PR001_g4349 [Phytophthora rubi]